MEIVQLKLALSQLGIHASDIQLRQVESFADLVFHTNQRFNLTAYKTREIIREKGIYDSLCFPHIAFQQSSTILDLGSGAGFPGIPLKILYPQLTMTLLEPNQKKAHFLQEVITTLDLTSIEVVSERAEILARNNSFKKLDYVVARAVAPLPMLLELVIPLLKVGGQALMLKGKDYIAEIAASKHALLALNAAVVQVQQHRLPTDHEERSLLTIEKKSETPFIYPRMFSQIKKSPL